MNRALLLLVLAGCPSSYGFRGQIVAAKAPIDMMRIDKYSNAPTSDQLVPVAGAQVTCQGCKDKITVGADGRFGVSLGSHYSAPAGITLHVTAPGHTPVDLEIAKVPHDSQLGYGAFVIVMKPQP